MNVLIIGLGSIGQRHLRNLRSIDKKIKFFSLRRKYITPLLDSKNQKRGKIEDYYNIKNFKSFDEIKKVDVHLFALSKFHVSEAIKLLKKYSYFYRKTIGSSLKNINKLKILYLINLK